MLRPVDSKAVGVATTEHHNYGILLLVILSVFPKKIYVNINTVNINVNINMNKQSEPLSKNGSRTFYSK